MMGVLAETSALSCTACKLFVPAQLGKFPVSLATVQTLVILVLGLIYCNKGSDCCLDDDKPMLVLLRTDMVIQYANSSNTW